MKVKDLLKEVAKCKRLYGKDFLNWDVYTEQLAGEDKRYKMSWQNWGVAGDSKGTYFKCRSFTKFMDKRIFTINVSK